MKSLKCILALTAFLLLLPAPVRSQDVAVKVIANKALTTTEINPRDLYGIYLLSRETYNSVAVSPVLAKDGPVHQSFLKNVLHCQDSTLQALYKSLVFTGKASMPKSFASDGEVVNYVANTKGAIGYVNASTPTPNVLTIEVKR